MTLAFAPLDAMNLLFLLIIALCLFVGLIAAPAPRDRPHEDADEDADEGADISPAFRIFGDGE